MPALKAYIVGPKICWVKMCVPIDPGSVLKQCVQLASCSTGGRVEVIQPSTVKGTCSTIVLGSQTRLQILDCLQRGYAHSLRRAEGL